MNIAYFLLPKNRIAYLYDDFTFRQGLEKMRHHGYTAIPVISRGGQYVGTVSEGDFLWHLLEDGGSLRMSLSQDLERLKIRDILDFSAYRPVRVTATLEDVISLAAQQNFIPVVDDVGRFIGIVTRKDVICRLAAEREAEISALSAPPSAVQLG